MGLDNRAIATGGYWRDSASNLVPRIVTFGYYDTFNSIVSVGGITDSYGSDLIDSEGNVIYDSLGVSEPGNPFGINSIITYGYWNTVTSQLNVRIASFGYLGSFGAPLVWLTGVVNKSWMALNSKFKMR